MHKKIPPYFPCALLLACASLWLTAGCKKEGATSTPVNTVTAKAPITGSRIGWDLGTLQKLSTATTGFSGYPRMAVLGNGMWCCVMEENGAIVSMRSSDEGITWADKKTVVPANGIYNNANPEILVLKNGNVLVFYNPRPRQESVADRFAIRVISSEDHALNFAQDKLLYEAGYQFANGCWEPAAIQLPSGEIQLFFANEAPYTQSNEQNISLLRSTNGGVTFTTQPETVSFRQGRRDGMPVPVYDAAKNRVWLSIEDNVNGEFKPYTLTNTLLENWKQVIDGNAANRRHALQESLDASVYAGAPYLRLLSNGEMVMSYQGGENRGNSMNNANMKVVLGSEGKDFNRKTVPFDIPSGSSALWNSLFVPNDSTIVALTSTNGFAAGRTEVWMIKGKLVAELSGNALRPDNYPVLVGNNAQARLQAGIVSTTEALQVNLRLQKLNTSATGIAFYINTGANSGIAPQEKQYRMHLDAQNQLTISVGENGAWKTTANAGITQSSAAGANNVQLIKLNIPWTAVGGKPPSGQRIPYHVALTNGAAAFSVLDNLSSNQPDMPYTWSGMTLN